MTMGHNQIASLPSQIALFPLSRVVLMPFAHIPLNVFEERYINLVDDCFSNGHYIGIVQPQIDASDPVPNDVAIYQTGTLARIMSFFDSADGTYQIIIKGLCAFVLSLNSWPVVAIAPRWSIICLMLMIWR